MKKNEWNRLAFTICEHCPHLDPTGLCANDEECIVCKLAFANPRQTAVEFLNRFEESSDNCHFHYTYSGKTSIDYHEAKEWHAHLRVILIGILESAFS